MWPRSSCRMRAPTWRAPGAPARRGGGPDGAPAGSAREALSLFHSHKPDVLVSDIGMPQHDGFQLLRWIRAAEPAHGPRTPALAFTAYASDDDRRRVLSAGFEAHLVKPFEPVALVDAINRVLPRRNGHT